MIASAVWTPIFDLVQAVLVVAVVWLIRQLVSIDRRLTRLEALEEVGSRERDQPGGRVGRHA